MNGFPIEFKFAVCILATWRVTHFVVSEDGPWNAVVRLRRLAGDGIIGEAMDCFYCSSMWLAIPFTFLMTSNILEWIVIWLAISGGASLLEKATNRPTPAVADRSTEILKQ